MPKVKEKFRRTRLANFCRAFVPERSRRTMEIFLSWMTDCLPIGQFLRLIISGEYKKHNAG